MTPEFDHYTVSRVLGEGGMGLVYLATDRRTGLPVAIKVMSRWAADPELQARFLKENRILSSLNHRNIVRCYEITESREGTPSIVMEYVDGVDFRAFEGRPYPELLPLMIQALMGLSYLRGQNILHRDLSSNNIFVTLENQTRVTKILDFGVAKVLQQQVADGDVKTRTGQFLGKFAFASPEHFLPSGVDWRSDVYSLGVIFHRLLTKKAPITVARKSNYYDWMVAHQQEHTFEVTAPAGVPPVPEALKSVVRRMLARTPDDRPRSYEEIIHVLDRVQRGLSPELEPDPEALRTLPPPVEGRIGSSSPSSPSHVPAPAPSPSPSPSSSPPAGRFFPVAAEGESRASVEESQQKRWPDLDQPESHTERFVAVSSPAVPAFGARPSRSQEVEQPDADSGVNPPRTELLPPPAPPESTKTAPTLAPERMEKFSEAPTWTGGAAKDSQPEPVKPTSPPGSSPNLLSNLLEEKTERLDDVIEKLRQQPVLEPPPLLTPPMTLPTTPEPPEPLHEPVGRSEPAPPTRRPSERAPAAPSKPGQRLFVYGEPSPAVVAPPRPVSRPVAPAAPPAPAPVPEAGGSRTRAIVIGVAVAAIVVLFAVVLWLLISFLRRAATGEPSRTSHADSTGAVAAATFANVHPWFRMKERP
jgi:serine/threonine protein kinase